MQCVLAMRRLFADTATIHPPTPIELTVAVLAIGSVALLALPLRDIAMGDVVQLNQARLQRQAASLEKRITTLLEQSDDAPEVTAEILRLRNEVWLVEAMTYSKGH